MYRSTGRWHPKPSCCSVPNSDSRTLNSVSSVHLPTSGELRTKSLAWLVWRLGRWSPTSRSFVDSASSNATFQSPNHQRARSAVGIGLLRRCSGSGSGSSMAIKTSFACSATMHTTKSSHPVLRITSARCSSDSASERSALERRPGPDRHSSLLCHS